MGFYLRKSFRAGPIRFNLSKSGIGVSGGVKGARLGVGPRGSYVHAGRHGLYYRKNLSSAQRAARSANDNGAAGDILLILLAIMLGLWLLHWLVQNPVVLGAAIAMAIALTASRWIVRLRRKQAVDAYKQSLDGAFVTPQAPPPATMLASLERRRQGLPKNKASKRAVAKIDADVYQAVLDKILDDGFITEEEAATIAAAERVLGVDPANRLQAKKELFAAAYLDVIENREVTQPELDRLNNLISGLAIPPEEIRRELDIVKEIIDTQALRLPFEPIPPEHLAAATQKSEKAFYQCSAQVLSKRKSKDSPTGHEYSVRREGTLILTDKRVFVVGGGTTNIRFSDIEDVDVDIDEGVIEIAKIRSSRPLALKTNAPIYTGRAIDLLVNAQAGASEH